MTCNKAKSISHVMWYTPERLIAHVANERLLISVLEHVRLEVTLRGRSVRAQVALEALLSLMGL